MSSGDLKNKEEAVTMMKTTGKTTAELLPARVGAWEAL
jgi:hypothetical protein